MSVPNRKKVLHLLKSQKNRQQNLLQLLIQQLQAAKTILILQVILALHLPQVLQQAQNEAVIVAVDDVRLLLVAVSQQRVDDVQALVLLIGAAVHALDIALDREIILPVVTDVGVLLVIELVGIVHEVEVIDAAVDVVQTAVIDVVDDE